jgi:hypothetical protein
MRKLWILTGLLILAMVTPVFAAPTPHIPIRAGENARSAGDQLRHSVSQAELIADFEHTAEYLDQYMLTAPKRPPVDPDKQSQTTAQWTVLVHVAGDNNLELAALADINEMEGVGSWIT